MPSPLDFLLPQGQNSSVTLDYLRRKRLEEAQRNRSLVGPGFSTGATASDVAQLENDINSAPDTGLAAQKQVADVEAEQAKQAAFNTPAATAIRDQQKRDKLAELLAVPQQQGQNAIALQGAKTQGALALERDKRDATQQLLQTLGGSRGGGGGSSNMGGPGSTIKPAINAAGGVSFSVTQMPALVQRARNQLMDARDKTMTALDQAERLYSGINDEAEKADVDTSKSALGRMFSGVTGVGAQKYGGPVDRANAGIERANYTLGIPTPFSELAQTASFGNIEQMAGQLPGVRGLATITPLFKEHQSRWGHETPLATVQRLRHMAKIMDETLHTLDTSGAAEPEPQQEF
jgi:hypothetical protein